MSTNYKKWDQFANNLLESSDDEGDESSRSVHVTKFDQASSIKIGPKGSEILKSTVCNTKSQQPDNDNGTLGTAKLSGSAILESTLGFPGKSHVTNLVQNGGYTGQFYWSQSRDEVIIRKPIANDLKASEITVAYNDNPSMRFEGIRPELKFTSKNGNEILSGRLQFDIIPNDDSESGVISRVDWELNTLPIESLGTTRMLEITLRKKSLIPGAIFWWRNVFVDDPEIDISEISGRNSSSRLDSDIWNEAHRKFQEKLQENTIVPIDVDD